MRSSCPPEAIYHSDLTLTCMQNLQVPGVGLEPSFLEEPVMLLAVVLLGRTLETRARLRATGIAPLSTQNLRV